LHHSQGQWFLELRASNKKAINLYQSLGFQKVGIRNNYYAAPPESAIVMRIFS
jgi:ribosomal-protein-alanine N-acetyltransferase